LLFIFPPFCPVSVSVPEVAIRSFALGAIPAQRRAVGSSRSRARSCFFYSRRAHLPQPAAVGPPPVAGCNLLALASPFFVPLGGVAAAPLAHRGSRFRPATRRRRGGCDLGRLAVVRESERTRRHHHPLRHAQGAPRPQDWPQAYLNLRACTPTPATAADACSGGSALAAACGVVALRLLWRGGFFLAAEALGAHEQRHLASRALLFPNVTVPRFGAHTATPKALGSNFALRMALHERRFIA